VTADESNKKIEEVAPATTGANEAAPESPGADEAAPRAVKAAKPRAARPKPAAAKADKSGKALKAEKPAAEKPAKRAAGATSKPRRTAAKPKAAEKAAETAATKGAEAVAESVEAAAPAEAARPSRLRRSRAARAKAEAPEQAAPRAKAERPPKPKVERPVHEPRRGTPGKATVITAEGAEVESRELPAARFAVPADVAVMHLAVRAEQAARRRGTASTKTRGEISGSTAKLFRQKGTGRARAGSIKSPVRTGGGTVFGPKPRSYDIKVNRKVAKKALAMALSNRAENGHVFVAAGLDLKTPSTRRLSEVLAAIDCAAPVLVVTHDEPVITKSVRNLFYAETAEVAALSTEQVLRARSLVLTEKAFDALNQA